MPSPDEEQGNCGGSGFQEEDQGRDCHDTAFSLSEGDPIPTLELRDRASSCQDAAHNEKAPDYCDGEGQKELGVKVHAQRAKVAA